MNELLKDHIAEGRRPPELIEAWRKYLAELAKKSGRGPSAEPYTLTEAQAKGLAQKRQRSPDAPEPLRACRRRASSFGKGWARF